MNKILFFCLILTVVSSIDCSLNDQLRTLKTIQLKNVTNLSFNKSEMTIAKKPQINCILNGKKVCINQPNLIKCNNTAYNQSAIWKCNGDNAVKNLSINNATISCLKSDNITYTSNPNSSIYLETCFLNYTTYATIGNGFTSTYLSSGLFALSFILSFLLGNKFQ